MGLPSATLLSIVSPTCSAKFIPRVGSEWFVGCFRQYRLWVQGVHMRKAVFSAICFAVLTATAYGQSSSTMADDQVNASYLRGVKPYSRATSSNADGGGVLGRHSSGAVLGIDSVTNWSSYNISTSQDSIRLAVCSSRGATQW
jgi:hypothetical protein